MFSLFKLQYVSLLCSYIRIGISVFACLSAVCPDPAYQEALDASMNRLDEVFGPLDDSGEFGLGGDYWKKEEKHNDNVANDPTLSAALDSLKSETDYQTKL